MHQLAEFIIAHSGYAPWITFIFILLAGFNIPVSIDVIMVLSAFLAATTIPEYTFALYSSVLFGCYFSAWIAYWVGRKWGIKLLNVRWFSKILCHNKLKKVGAFYEKYGFFTLLLGRFIPFGVRNCLFMTTGMSKMHFGKFILRDAVACLVWTSVCFYAFYSLGMNYQLLLQRIKVINLFIFLAFGVTVIGLIWYKRHKKKRVN